MADSKRLTSDAFLILFAALSSAACEKKAAPDVQPEKTPAVTATGAEGAAKVEAKEVPGPAPSGSTEGQKGCAPGGCAPGACGGQKKE